MPIESGTLSIKEKISNGLRDTSSNFFLQMLINFLLFICTDGFGISAGFACTMFLFGSKIL
jgi:Na+/melibiose symporter-like transporter